MTKFVRTCIISMAAFAAPAAFAALDGTISGTVKDVSGQPLPGVSVTVSGASLQGQRTAVTKADGSYLIANLPPGTGYKVNFALQGFKSLDRTDVRVALSADTQVAATLDLTSVVEGITVTADAPVVDVTKTNTSTNFGGDYLKKVPIGSGGRTYQSVLAAAPGVTTGGGNPNVMGGNILENSWMVDGINTTDPVTHTFSFNLNPDAIQEINLQTSGFEAEFGRASGGIVNVVTKSGGNEFSGSADIRYSTNKFSESTDLFNADLTTSKNIQPAFTLGGPVLKDRLWFFGNVQRPITSATPFTTSTTIRAENPNPVPREFKGWNYGLKLSFTVSPQFNGFVNYTKAEADIPGSTNSASVRPEAASTQIQEAEIFNLKLNGFFSSTLLGEIQVGQSNSSLTSQPTSGNLTTPRWTNRLSGVAYDNFNNFQTSDRDRTQFGGAATIFLTGMGGNHQIKIGADGEKTKFPSSNFTTGTPSNPAFCPTGATCGATFTFSYAADGVTRIPFAQAVVERAPVVERSGSGFALYAQDQWRPINQLTVNLGVRYDVNNYNNNQDIKVLDFKKFQPRISAAFDVMGDGKTSIRANYGLFYVDAALTLARLFDTGYNSPVTRNYRWNTTTQAWGFLSQTGGAALTSALIDGPLKPTYDIQYNFAVEREIFRGLSTSVTYINKKTKDIYEDTCINQTECPDFWISNQPGRDIGIQDYLQKTYKGIVFQTRYTFTRGIVDASYTWSKSQGTIDSADGQYAADDADLFPDNFINRYGYLNDDARNRFKVFGSYRVPFIETDFVVNYTYRSGATYNVVTTSPNGFGNVFVDPRGSNRTKILHNVDFELRKEIPLSFIKSGFSATVIGTVLNATNSEQPTTYSTNGNAGANPAARTPTAYQRPRNYQVGFRMDF